MIDTRRGFLGALSILLLTSGIGGPGRADAEDAPRITAAELKPLIARGEAILVDVRNQTAWEFGHIEGAKHIPLAEIESRLGELPKNKLIACYCT